MPSLHHPSFTKKKNITTRARTIHTTRFISARVIYIYIYIRRPRRLLCFFLLFGLFLSLSLKRNTTPQNGEERHRRPTTKNTHVRRLFVCVLNLRALICAHISLSLSLLRSHARRRGKEEQRNTTTDEKRFQTQRPSERRQQREGKKSARRRTTSSSPLSRKATGHHQKLSLQILHLGF